VLFDVIEESIVRMLGCRNRWRSGPGFFGGYINRLVRELGDTSPGREPIPARV
jgi:hypothetical protein